MGAQNYKEKQRNCYNKRQGADNILGGGRESVVIGAVTRKTFLCSILHLDIGLVAVF